MQSSLSPLAPVLAAGMAARAQVADKQSFEVIEHVTARRSSVSYL
jgi:hypothetical protein